MATAKKKSGEKKSDLKKLAEKLIHKPKLIWDELDEAGRREADAVGRDYRDFLSRAKTERAVVKEIVKKAEAAGFTDLAKLKGKSAGKGGYLVHQGKLAGLFVPGQASPAEGFNLIVAHGDSPRLDLKPRCAYEDASSGFGLLKTNLYGGLKKFQWLTRPLALWGFCALKDGRQVEIIFGEDPADPVLTINDILPHLDRNVQRGKKISEAIAAEKMNLIAASIPLGDSEDKDRLKLAVLKILNDRWGLVEEDLISSELEIVPAGPAREVGLDGSLIGGYGQDDRLTVFAALKAMSLSKKAARPSLILVYDREEIGSYGSTGAAGGNFVEHLAIKAFEASGLKPEWPAVRSALLNTNGLSADVEAAIDPDYKEVHEELNSARMGRGPCLIRYTGGAGKYGASEAGAEYMARVRAAFDRADVRWQTSLLGKQEEGGGGTEALYMAAFGMNIVDCGPPVLSMHSPFEISSKADLLMTVRAYAAFLMMA
ncbi:aminopeptidase [Deltaproteobacteria bacterium OttesenSCG-928-M10]|nr:aminopeptidase [Deltaproteobacteria bacterium OttesenSCG-928-M10]